MKIRFRLFQKSTLERRKRARQKRIYSLNKQRKAQIEDLLRSRAVTRNRRVKRNQKKTRKQQSCQPSRGKARRARSLRV